MFTLQMGFTAMPGGIADLAVVAAILSKLSMARLVFQATSSPSFSYSDLMSKLTSVPMV